MQDLTFATIQENLRGPLFDERERGLLSRLTPDRRQVAETERREKTLEHITNQMSGENARTLAHLCTRWHRTLQQSLVRDFIVPFLRELADNHAKGFSDPRNEASCLFAKRAVAIADELGFPSI